VKLADFGSCRGVYS